MMPSDHRDFPVVKAKWDILSEKKREERGRREDRRKEGRRKREEKERDTLKGREGTPALMACLHQGNNSLRIIYNAYLSKGWTMMVIILNHRIQIYKYLIKC